MPAENVVRANIEKVIAEVRKGREGDYNISQVMSFAELMIEAVQTFLNTYDNAVYNEMREIGAYITNAKDEIGNLQANDIQENHIPEAGRELDEIVKSTEEATNKIMEAAENIMSIETDDLASYQEKVNDEIMGIFEACSFQDITGQRINKVVHTLKYIENRISRFSDAFGMASGDAVLTEEEAEYERRKNELILHGPAMGGEGTDQDAIDALLDMGDAPLEEPESMGESIESLPTDLDSLPEEETVPAPEVSKEAAVVEEKPVEAKVDKAPEPKKEAAPKEEVPEAKKETTPEKEEPAAKKEAAPKKEAPAAKKEAAPKKEAPAAKKEAAPKKEAPEAKKEAAPKKEVPEAKKEAAPKKEAPEAKKEAAPKKETPAAKKEAAPKKEAPAAKKEAPTPKKEAAAAKPAPAEEDAGDGNSQADIDALFD